MNQTESYEIERVSQILSVLKAAVKKNVTVPEKLRYAPEKLNFNQLPVFQEFRNGGSWGGFDQYGWFQCLFEIPEKTEGCGLWIEITQNKRDWYAQNPQFLLYCNQIPMQGFDIYHEECLITEHARGKETVCIDIDAWSGMVLKDVSWDDRENRPGILSIRFYEKDCNTERLYYDMKSMLDTAVCCGKESDEGIILLHALHEAVNLLDLREIGSESYDNSIKEAAKYLKEEFFLKRCGSNGKKARCVGHTHIDVAWMWQKSHTRNKTVRSFQTALKLLEEYPEFIFMSSQPQLYEYFREAQPEEFEKIKKYTNLGRWEAEGGMWVEADCNLTSGESLIRQFLEGKQYFKEQFGTESRILWLPDVFGYSAALPQICRKCGIDYFMTTKISWNEQDQIPYDTFLWKGIDGSELLTHFSPSRRFDHVEYNSFGFARSPHITTYNAELSPDYVMGGWKRYAQKSLNTEFLMPCGFGDGGGGTTREMVECGKRMSYGLPGAPEVQFSTAGEFFEKLEADTEGNPALPVWYGELYLEFHRGTYTSVGEIKRLNRIAETLLQRCEFLYSLLAQAEGPEIYPYRKLKQWIRIILTNQFHDILPGSAIDAVYDDCRKEYEEILPEMESTAVQAMERIAGKWSGRSLIAFNTFGFARNSRILFACDSDAEVLILTGEDGMDIPAQKTPDGQYCAELKAVPGAGAFRYRIRETCEHGGFTITYRDNIIESPYYKIRLNENGTMASLYDREADRELLGGAANVLEVYEDRPYQYDAWELSPYYREKRYELNHCTEVELVEQGPVRIGLRFVYRYLSSTVRQTLYVYSNSRRLDFVTDIDWQEEHLLLKAAFPVNIVSQKAVYEIQFGTVERPTHTNTSWDAEKFETCAQRFADLSEGNYGVSLLSDCKYGYDIHDGVMRLSLLRSAVFPNRQDRGFHHFTYSLYPHPGDYREAGVFQEAYDLLSPVPALFSKVEGQQCGTFPCRLAVCNTPGIFIETVKRAEDGDGWIIRAYEGFGNRVKAGIEIITEAPCTLKECDMLERGGTELSAVGNCFTVVFNPFEIKTFRMQK